LVLGKEEVEKWVFESKNHLAKFFGQHSNWILEKLGEINLREKNLFNPLESMTWIKGLTSLATILGILFFNFAFFY
jgi:hypothetical protein